MTDRPNRTPVIIGFLVAGSVLAGLSIFAEKFRGTPGVQTPMIHALTTEAPAGQPLQLRFVTDAALEIGSMGWVADGLHPHALVDTVSIMAAPRDLVHIAADTFVWSLPALPPGDHQIRLYWADMRHRAVGDSMPHRVRVTP